MTLLLLAGSGEARAIAQQLADAGCAATASLAGATRAPHPLALPTRIGGFGGADGFRRYLVDQQITAVLDATHPFAHRISQRTHAVTGEMGLPYAQFLRPPWAPDQGDNWTLLDHESKAAAYIQPGSTVFLATGRQTLERFENLASCRLICRQIDPPEGPFPFENGQFLVGRPPFSVADEVALFQKLAVDWLIVKNAGGVASRTKLDAARHLGLPVAMIKRPPLLQAQRFETVTDAVTWARAL